MNIELSHEDLRQMPPNVAIGLLNWLQYQRHVPPSQSKTADSTEQLSLKLVSQSQPQLKPPATMSTKKIRRDPKHPHILLSQLLDAGITKAGMAVRVRLKTEVAKETGHSYVTKNLKISAKGTVVYNGQEFYKPSPLAESINGSSTNGWEYVEVKKNGQWVCLNELRQIWRKVS